MLHAEGVGELFGSKHIKVVISQYNRAHNYRDGRHLLHRYTLIKLPYTTAAIIAPCVSWDTKTTHGVEIIQRISRIYQRKKNYY